MAKAQQKAQTIRGKGDAAAMEITNKAFGADPEFYGFYRSLEAYKKTMTESTSLYLSSDHPFLKFLHPYTK